MNPTSLPALPLPKIGLGGAVFGREIDEAASWDILDYALARGVNLVDTAESYGGANAREYRRATYGTEDVREASGELHSSEKIIGRWMRARQCRDRLLVCTKLSTDGSAAGVRAAVAASLERLQTDRVDLYLLHHPFRTVPVRETLAALTEEVRAGRIRAIGCSNFTVPELDEANRIAAKHGLVPLTVVEPALSLVHAEARTELMPYCRAHKIPVVTYSPLGAGFLSGKYASGQIPPGTRFGIIPGHAEIYFHPRNFALVENLRRLSAETGHAMVTLALAWVFQCNDVSSVLIGARHRAHLDNAFAALALPLQPAVAERMNSWLTTRP